MTVSTSVSGLWSRLVALAEARPEARAINRLNAMSDEDLAARGLTRAGEARRILASRYLY
jgi:uncharacterized protein YjiS (DUF1127 family)